MSELKYFKCACPHCAGHIEFPENRAGETIDCPHCRQKMKLSTPGGEPEPPPAPPKEKGGAGAETGTGETSEKNGKTLPILAVLIVLAAGAGGFFLYQKKQPAATTAPSAASGAVTSTPRKITAKIETPAKPAKSLADLKVDAVTLDKAKDGNLVYATGTLRNDSDYQRFGVKIEIELLDAAERKVGTATDYIQIMEPRDDWRFRALVNDSKTVKVKIASITED